MISKEDMSIETASIANEQECYECCMHGGSGSHIMRLCRDRFSFGSLYPAIDSDFDYR